MQVRFKLGELLRSLRFRLAAFCFLTVVAMWAHGVLPKRHSQLFPSPPFYINVYADLDSSGQRVGRLISQDPLVWECDVPTSGAVPPCGLALGLSDYDEDGTDLSFYDQLRVDMSVDGGIQKVRFSFRDFVPGYSQHANVDTMKFENVYVPAGDIGPGLVVGFNEFRVADWWLDHNSLPRNRISSDFGHAVTLGIDMASNAEPGTHRYTVRHIELAGELISKENWYLGILMMWIAAIIVGSVAHVIALMRRHREESRRYHEISKRDHLTGLFNRYGAFDWIGAEKCDRGVLIILDVDHFKNINDRYGHDCGDKVLRQIADVLAGSVRASDCLARWGGEEFLVYLPRTNLAAATKIAEKLRHSVQHHKFAAIPGLSVTVSLGIGEFEPAEPFDRLFERVDQALFRAKRLGRNRVEAAEAGV
jgi:diguanylate cyclase (GGDEF)-like protein